MGLHDELQDLPPDAPVCSRCGRMCEPLEIQQCPSCQRPFCNYCVFRMGGAEYCGRQCGESMFFGGMDSEDGMSDEDDEV